MEHLHFFRKPQETSHTPLPRVLLDHPAPRVALERWKPLDPLLLGDFRVLHRVYFCKVDRCLESCLLKVRLGRLVKSQSIQKQERELLAAMFSRLDSASCTMRNHALCVIIPCLTMHRA